MRTIKSILKKFDEGNRYFLGYFPIALGLWVLGTIEWAKQNNCTMNFDSTSAITIGLGFAVLFTLSHTFGKFKPQKFNTKN